MAELEIPPITVSLTTLNLLAFVAESSLSIRNNSVYVSFAPSFTTTSAMSTFLENGSLLKIRVNQAFGLFPRKYPIPNAAAVKETVVPMFSRAMTISFVGFPMDVEIC